MNAKETGTGGVYRLYIDGRLTAEFAPGPIWSEFYQHATATYASVAVVWKPFVDEQT